MEHMNRIELIGTVGTVRIQQLNVGCAANFSLCTEHLFKLEDGSARSECTWVNVVAFESEKVRCLDRLDRRVTVHLTGRIRNSRYMMSDGTETMFTEVVADFLEVMDDDIKNDSRL